MTDGAPAWEDPQEVVSDGAPQRRDEDRAAPTNVIRLLVLLGIGAAAAYVIARLLLPFLPAIVTSTVLAALFQPAQRHIRRRVRSVSFAAFLGTTIIFFLVLLPLLGLSLLLAREISTGLQWVSGSAADVLAPQGRVAQWLDSIGRRLGMDGAAFRQAIGAQAQAVAGGLAGRTLGIISGLGGWLLQAGIALFSLYYLLRDGDRLVAAVKWLIPLRAEDTDHLVNRALEVTYATVYGNVAVAMAQGALGGLAFLALGIPGAALWGTVMGVLSLLPAVGAFLVWVPGAIWLIANDQLVRGLILIGFGALVISSVDNLLRALLVSGRAQLHPLIAFFSVLGGLVVFGATGIFIGPVLFVLSLALVEMARVAVEPDPAAREALRASLPLASRPLIRSRERRWGARARD